MKNSQIYKYAENLLVFSDCNIKIPVRINFFLQKNIQTIIGLGQEIEIARMKIAQDYGTPNEDGTGYNIPQENLQEAQKEMNDLFNLEQDVNLHIFKLDDFDGIELTY